MAVIVWDTSRLIGRWCEARRELARSAGPRCRRANREWLEKIERALLLALKAVGPVRRPEGTYRAERSPIDHTYRVAFEPASAGEVAR